MKNLKIKYVKDCFGAYAFFGCEDGTTQTDAWDCLDELIEMHPQFEKAVQEYRLKQVEEARQNILGALCEIVDPWAIKAPEIAIVINKLTFEGFKEQIESGWLDYIKDHQENAALLVLHAMREFTDQVKQYLTAEQKELLGL